MAHYIFVHGGNMSTDQWNTLANRQDYPTGEHLGGKVWDSVTPALVAAGHQVFCPTLGDPESSDLSEHINQITSLITKHELHDVVLVGHSYGGMVITGVACKIPEKISRLVYLDAALPDSGQSLFDILTQAGLNPVEITDGSAIAYTQKLEFNFQTLSTIKKTYILCTQSEFIAVTAIAKDKIDATANTWQYIELTTGHVPQATMPEELSQLLLNLS